MGQRLVVSQNGYREYLGRVVADHFFSHFFSGKSAQLDVRE